MSGFRRAARRPREGEDAVIGTFAPFEARLLRQFVHELVLLLQAEAGAGLQPEPDPSPPVGTVAAADPELVDDAFAAITAGLDGGATAVVHPPDDPVLARLFPTAYTDDDESAADFRRFTQDRLVDRKHRSAQAVLAMLPTDDELDGGLDGDGLTDAGGSGPDDEREIELRLDRASAMDWLATLNDVRLALGTRLGVQQDDDEVWAALPDDDATGTVHHIYQWLGWVQETLVAALPSPRR